MPPRRVPARGGRAAVGRGRAAPRGGRAAPRGGRAGRRGRGTAESEPAPSVAASADHGQEEDQVEQQGAQVEFDWEQAIRLAAGEGVPQEAIEAGILATRRAMQARGGAVSEGAGSAAQGPVQAVAPVRAEQVGSAAQSVEAEEKRRETQMKYFKRMGAPLFTGLGTAVEADDWIRELKKIFDTMGVSREADRVRLAAFQLRSEADQWWSSETRIRDPETFTWEDFTKAFFLRFFPRAMQQQLADRFASLRQGFNVSVQEYHASFIQLGHFAPQSTAEDEPGLAWKFMKGLKPEFRPQMVGHPPLTVSEAYDSAISLEEEFADAQRRRDFRSRRYGDDRPGKRQHQQPQAPPPPPVLAALPEQIRPAALPAPPAQQQPRGPPGACFYCKQPGHFRDSCPKLLARADQAGPSRQQHQRPPQQQQQRQPPPQQYLPPPQQQYLPPRQPQQTAPLQYQQQMVPYYQPQYPQPQQGP